MGIPSSYIPDKTLAFIDQLVFCRDEYKHVLVMALAVSHIKWHFSAVPYVLATSDKAASGKSTIAFDIPMLLAENIESIDKTTSRDGMNALWLERETPNTAWDDIGKIFGPNGTGGTLSHFYTQLVRSYKRNATTKMSRNGAVQKPSTYGMAFLNGLFNAVPNDLFTRCIHFKMEEAPNTYELRDVLDDSTEADAKILKEALHGWAGSHADEMKRFVKDRIRRVHPALAKRRRQKWGPLFAAAYAAGGNWPRYIYDAFVAIELDASEKPKLLPEQFLLLDTANKILLKNDRDRIFTSDLVEELRALPDGQYYQDVEDEHLLKRLFPETFGEAKQISGVKLHGEHAGQKGKARGYMAEPILEAALELYDQLYPQPEEMEDELSEDLEFVPTGRGNA